MLVQGPDIDQLQEYMQAFMEKLRTVPGVVDVGTNFELSQPELRVSVDRVRAAGEPWTRQYLELIAAKPGVVARELALGVGLPRDDFKVRVRRLKELGLTESLEVGYRLSPRGRAYLDATTPPVH